MAIAGLEHAFHISIRGVTITPVTRDKTICCAIAKLQTGEDKRCVHGVVPAGNGVVLLVVGGSTTPHTRHKKKNGIQLSVGTQREKAMLSIRAQVSFVNLSTFLLY